LQIGFIGNIYRLSAVCNGKIKHKSLKKLNMFQVVSPNSTKKTTFNDSVYSQKDYSTP